MFSEDNLFSRHNRIHHLSDTTRGAKCKFLFGCCGFGSFLDTLRGFVGSLVFGLAVDCFLGLFELFFGICNDKFGGCVTTSSTEGVVVAGSETGWDTISTSDAASVILEELFDILVLLGPVFVVDFLVCSF